MLGYVLRFLCILHCVNVYSTSRFLHEIRRKTAQHLVQLAMCCACVQSFWFVREATNFIATNVSDKRGPHPIRAWAENTGKVSETLLLHSPQMNKNMTAEGTSTTVFSPWFFHF